MKQTRKSLKSLKKFFFIIVSVMEVVFICAVTFCVAAYINIVVLDTTPVMISPYGEESENDIIAVFVAFIACVVMFGSIFLGMITYEKLKDKYC